MVKAQHERLARRRRMEEAIRRWFDAQGFQAVETPALQATPGAEAHLQAVACVLTSPRRDARATRYLHTSPELAMKKLLAQGCGKIWQRARVWRDGEGSSLHHPEFTLLEWYRVGVDLEVIAADVAGLLRTAALAAGTRWLRRGDGLCDPFAPLERVTVIDAFAAVGVDLAASLVDPDRPDAAILAAAMARAGFRVAADDGWEDLVFRALGERIEPSLGFGRPCLLCDYPAPMAALARRSPTDPRVALRFELYVCGVELANAFDELTDPAEQRRRFDAEMAVKQALYGAAWPRDEDFFAALAAGPRQAAGIALGLDRLAMLAVGAERIEEVLWAPVAAPWG